MFMKKSLFLLVTSLLAYTLMHQTVLCSTSAGSTLKRARADEDSMQEYKDMADLDTTTQEYIDSTDPDDYPTARPLKLIIPPLPPAPPAAATSSKAPTIQETMDEIITCPITMQDMRKGSMPSLPCNHFFDREGIKMWFDMGDTYTCPICKRNASDLREKNNLLFDAAKKGRTTDIRKILDSGAVVDAISNGECGKTPLMVAAMNGHVKAVEMLLAANANIHAKDYLNHTALLFAISYKHPRVVKALIAQTPEPDERKKLLNIIDNYGVTPLHRAIYPGGLTIVKALKEAGADTTAKNIDGQTPLEIAQIYSSKLPSGRETKQMMAIVDFLERNTPGTTD